MSIGLASCFSRNLVLRGSTLLILQLVLPGVPNATSQTIPYSLKDIEKLAKDGTPEDKFIESVKQHGIGFAPTIDVIEELKASHVPDSVLKEIWAHIPQGQSPEFYLREGDRLMTSGYYAQAVAYYQRMLALLPDDPVAKARMKQASEQQQKADADAQLRAAQDNERLNLPYYRQQLSAFLEKSNCEGAFHYAHKIFFIGPDPSEKAAFEKVCGPYSLSLKEGTPVTLELQRDLSGSGEHSGERIDFKVVDPVVLNGLLVVPKDGIAWGTVAKSSGGRRFARAGQLRISIEGMSLADGERCPLAAAESYHGPKKGKAGTAIESSLGVGVPLLFIHGKDPKVPAGTKVQARVAGMMNLDPARFVASAPSPGGPGIPVPPQASSLNVILFQNQAGTDATVRRLGPSVQVLTVVNGQSFGARVAAGDYYVLIRYGKSASEYLFEKAGPIPITEPSGKHSVVHITLQRPAADNPTAREEFYKGQ